MRTFKRLKHERNALRVSQQAIETATGVPQCLLSLAETGRYVPTAEQLDSLSRFFRVPADELLKDVVVLEPTR